MRPFCDECRAVDDRWRKDKGRHRNFGFVVEFDRKQRKKRNAVAKVNARERAKAERVREKPWLADGLSEGERYKLRYSLDVAFMLRERMRRRLRRKGFGFDILWRMRQSLNGEVGAAGTITIERALGYSISDLRAHLEKQFTNGMSWEAFRQGRIHIDHKVPISRFDLVDPQQVEAAWKLGNLQPLWAEDNMAKGARTDGEWRAAA